MQEGYSTNRANHRRIFAEIFLMYCIILIKKSNMYLAIAIDLFFFRFFFLFFFSELQKITKTHPHLNDQVFQQSGINKRDTIRTC